MACSSCKERSAVRAASANRTGLTQAIPEEDQVEVTYLGGQYFHKIISPNGALFPYGYSNYGYGQGGDILIIHRGDLLVKPGGRKLFEPMIEAPKIMVAPQVVAKMIKVVETKRAEQPVIEPVIDNTNNGDELVIEADVYEETVLTKEIEPPSLSAMLGDK